MTGAPHIHTCWAPVMRQQGAVLVVPSATE
jgi:hypothetical protein